MLPNGLTRHGVWLHKKSNDEEKLSFILEHQNWSTAARIVFLLNKDLFQREKFDLKYILKPQYQS